MPLLATWMRCPSASVQTMFAPVRSTAQDRFGWRKVFHSAPWASVRTCTVFSPPEALMPSWKSSSSSRPVARSWRTRYPSPSSDSRPEVTFDPPTLCTGTERVWRVCVSYTPLVRTVPWPSWQPQLT